jgi:hypothetical protein
MAPDTMDQIMGQERLVLEAMKAWYEEQPERIPQQLRQRLEVLLRMERAPAFVGLVSEPGKPIYDAVKDALRARGWGIDPNAKERPDGELHEFIHPVTGKRRAWFDALGDQGALEINQ